MIGNKLERKGGIELNFIMQFKSIERFHLMHQYLCKEFREIFLWENEKEEKKNENFDEFSSFCFDKSELSGKNIVRIIEMPKVHLKIMQITN